MPTCFTANAALAERAASQLEEASVAELHVLDNGVRKPLDRALLLKNCEAACFGLGDVVSARTIYESALKNLYDGVPLADVYQALILAARTLIEREPAYNQVTARLLLASLGREVLGRAG